MPLAPSNSFAIFFFFGYLFGAPRLSPAQTTYNRITAFQASSRQTTNRHFFFRK
jgi:hypothetical protein